MRYLLLCSAASLALSTLAFKNAEAGPAGGSVAAGKASIHSDQNNTNIHQQSNKVIIDWQSFNIQTNEHTQFHQPSSGAIALNRIHDVNPSQIDGKLSANGHIVLMNQNGIVFGQNSIVDVGSLTATTADIDNDDFMSGNYDFKHAGNANAKIINKGSISAADAGLVNLVAPQVINEGVIFAKMGKVQLAAADTFTIDMAGDNMIHIAVEHEDAKKLSKNTGTVQAEGGYIAMTAANARNILDSVVETSGIIEASSMSSVGGRIFLGSDGGTTKVKGTVKANGKTGGGEILIGGDYQGQGYIPTSGLTELDKQAVVQASANDTGDGGKIIVWADENASVSGIIEAKAGENAGDGGFIETSAKKIISIDKDTKINVSAPEGKGGEWLLDPEDIVISDGGNDGDANTSDVATATINATLNGGGNVTITTAGAGPGNGDITLDNANIDKSVANNDATLTLEALRNIRVNNSTIDSTSGDALNVVLNADTDANNIGAIEIENSTITTNGGNFVAGGGADPTTTAAHAGQDGVYDQGVEFSNVDISTGTGNISIRGEGEDTGNSNHGVRIRNTSTLTTTSGLITINGTGGSGEDNNAGVMIQNNNTIISSATGNINITGIGGTNGGADSDQNYGVDVRDSAIIRSTGSGPTAATITLDGTGAAGDDDNHGIIITNADTTITSIDGDISITGVAQAHALASSNTNRGIYLLDANILSTGIGTDAATITLHGTGGDGEEFNQGITASFASVIQSRDGAISLTGIGGADAAATNYNIGISINGSSDIISLGTGSNAATITLHGTGGAAEDANNGVVIDSAGSSITSVDGDIRLTGIAGSNGNDSSSYNYGIDIYNGSFITSTGSSSDAASITLDGTGGNGEEYNYGVNLNNATSYITSDAGNIEIIGQGGTNGSLGSNRNYGVYIRGDSYVSSTGTDDLAGSITIRGTGGAGEDNNIGVYVEGDSTTISTDDGNISLTGTGSAAHGGASSGYYGINIASSADINSTGDGDISFDAAASGQTDIRFDGGTGNITANEGNITVAADSHDVNNNQITSTSGNIAFTPKTASTAISLGGASVAGTFSLDDADLATISAGGTLTFGDSANGTGDITVTSWDYSAQNHSVELYGNDITLSGITMGSGGFLAHGMDNGGDTADINIDTAISRNTAGTATLDLRADSNIYMTAGANITEGTGILNVILNANRDNVAADWEGGVNINTVNITTNGGNFIIGGGTDPENTPVYNMKSVEIQGSNIITGAGNVTITGTSNTGAGNWWQGLYIHSNNDITTTTGNITLTGIARATGTTNEGIRLHNTDLLTTSGVITITGSSLNSNAADSNGFLLDGGSTITSTGGAGAGDISITGNAFATDDINIDGTITANAADIIFNGDSVDIGNNITTNANMSITPRTATTTIGLGGGTGILNLTDAELAFLSVGNTLTVGDSASGTGAIDIDTVDVSAGAYDVEIYGGNLTTTNLNVGGTLLAKSTGSITLDGSITSVGAGNSLTLVSGTGLTNNAGAGALNPGAGRYLVYTTTPSATTKGGLSGANLYNRTYTANAPATIAGTSDRFIYSYQPTVTFTADNIVLNEYNPSFADFTYTTTGLVNDDSLAYAGSGAINLSSVRQNPGNYLIDINGTYTSSIGYLFNYIDGVLTMPSEMSQISGSVQQQISEVETSSSQTSSMLAEQRQIPPKLIIADSSEQDSVIRIASHENFEVEQPIVNFFELCNYSIHFCK